MDDLGRFHGASSSACPLCHYVCEDALHFIAVCPQGRREGGFQGFQETP